MQRKVGQARTEGRSDGLTKAQAEKALRQIREIESPGAVARSRKVTMAEAGAELSRRLELKGRKKSHRLTVAVVAERPCRRSDGRDKCYSNRTHLGANRH